MNNDVIKQKDVMIRLLEALFPQVKIYLFGSRAKGTHRPSSDIDLALDAGRQLSFLEIAKAKNVLDALNIAEKIDVVDMRSIPEALKETILQEGIIWKS
ncbi:MAG TPA: nucleotidyltransferase domain-containing protein [Candidatus Babeliales bacterium]|nr:nucleotidyltransferase domain-containing protein [Candidatus Babeliales bacterium]